MIYLLYGVEQFLIDKKIKEIKDKHNIDNLNIVNYDLNINPIDEVLEDCMIPSMFSDKKFILVTNSVIFTGTKSSIEHNLDNLINYLNHNNPDTILVFEVNSDKLDERKKIVKTIKDKHTVVELNSNNINQIVKEMFKNYQINNEVLNLFINRVGHNLDILEQEANKIMIYKDNDLVITKDDILNLTTKNIDADIFKLVNAIIENNKEVAIEIYNEMLLLNEEPIKIIVTLANQLRIIYQVKELYKKGYTEKDITGILKIHPYRIKLALQNSYKYDSKQLLKYLYQLANLDIDIKSGLADKKVAFELFILSI